jgi:hypothetical protein
MKGGRKEWRGLGGGEGGRLGLEAHVHWALVHDAREEPTLHPVEGAELVVELHCGQEWRRDSALGKEPRRETILCTLAYLVCYSCVSMRSLDLLGS